MLNKIGLPKCYIKKKQGNMNLKNSKSLLYETQKRCIHLSKIYKYSLVIYAKIEHILVQNESYNSICNITLKIIFQLNSTQ